MRASTRKYLLLVTDVLVLILAILGGMAWWQTRYQDKSQADRSARPELDARLKIGRRVPNEVFGSGPAVIFLLSPQCPACTKGIPIYKELLKKSSLKTIAFFSSSSVEDATAFLKTVDFKPDSVLDGRTVQLDRVYTPSALFIDSTGEVKYSSIGVLDHKSQIEFSRSLKLLE
jgi:hypothetical protein